MPELVQSCTITVFLFVGSSSIVMCFFEVVMCFICIKGLSQKNQKIGTIKFVWSSKTRENSAIEHIHELVIGLIFCMSRNKQQNYVVEKRLNGVI